MPNPVPPQFKNHLFKKGVASNPGGKTLPMRPETIERRKMVENVRELCRTKSIDAVNALVEIVNSKTASPSARVVAANAILDRAFGKPQVTVEATVTNYDTMSERELMEYISGKTIEGEVVKALQEEEDQNSELLDEGDE